MRVCRDQEQLHHPCLGLLLYYQNGQVESLGQIRWDQDLSHEVLAPIRIQSADIIDETDIIDGRRKNHIKNVQRDALPADSGLLDEGVDEWLVLPEYGTIVWWFGHIGDRVVIYND